MNITIEYNGLKIDAFYYTTTDQIEITHPWCGIKVFDGMKDLYQYLKNNIVD